MRIARKVAIGSQLVRGEAMDFDRPDMTEDEQGFLDRTREAWELIRIATQAVADASPQGPERNELPFSTIWRLQMTVSSRALAVLQTLQLSQTSEAGLVLVRNLIEGFAHLQFIKGTGKAEGNPKCRALRYELGVLLEARDTVLKLGQDNDEIHAEHAKRQEELRSVETGCTCRTHAPLSRGHVPDTLKAIGVADPSLKILVTLYSDASRATHMLSGADHLLSLGEDGSTELSWVSLERRVTWLIWMMLLFGQMAVDAEALMAGPESRRLTDSGFIERGPALINDPFLERLAALATPAE